MMKLKTEDLQEDHVSGSSEDIDLPDSRNLRKVHRSDPLIDMILKSLEASFLAYLHSQVNEKSDTYQKKGGD